MLISEISSPNTRKPAKARKSLKPIKPLKTIKPLKKSLPSIKPQTPDQAMIAARKRDLDSAKQKLKGEQEFQRRHRKLEKQRKARNPSSR